MKTGDQDMACSGSSSGEPSSSHDVFLSFRGKDTRKSFTGHLYKALCRKGIKVFMDTELRRGDEISPALLGAIEASRASIIIFSKNYASSSWCLDELVKILKCKKHKGQMVRPIFVDVDPSEIRNQTGSIGEAMASHEETCTDVEKVKRWRKYLKKAANLSGWHLGNGDESEFIQRIVEEIFSKLNRTILAVAKNPVGLDPQVQAVNALLSIGSNDVHVVGIHGVGGIGKSNIAKAIYNMVADRFEGSSFLANVRAISKKHGVVRLQEMLLSDILGEMDLMVGYVFNGIELIKKHLTYKRIFLVLDDVDNSDQLKQLMGEKDWFGSGSRIVITTRDETLLVNHGIDTRYEVNELQHNHAIELLSWNAFEEPCPRDQYKMLSNILVSVVPRLPLALIVLGSFLYGKSPTNWGDLLKKLKSMPDNNVNAIIKMSFDELGGNAESIFLDIACFFEGEDIGFITKHLDRCNFHPDVGIQILKDRALIDILNGKILMHEVIQEFGREVVRQESPQEPGKRSRIWHHDDVQKVLKENSGTPAIQGLKLDFPGAEEIIWQTNAIKKMKRLRLLMVRDSHFSCCPKYLCKDLSQMNIHDPLSSIPSAKDSRYNCILEEPACTRLSILRGKIILIAFSKFIKQQTNCGQGGCSDLKCFHLVSEGLVFLAITIPRQLIQVMASSSSIVCRRLFRKSCFSFHSEGLEKLIDIDSQMQIIRQFSFKEVYAAIGDSTSGLVGRGGSGSVFLGELCSGRRVAVKWFSKNMASDAYSQLCFVNELKSQAHIKHKNIVTLLGYCLEQGERILVYDYMSNGTLHQHLNNEESPYLMSWVNRMKTALEIARALQYLHFYAVPPIIHRDVKTSNVMFDDEWTAKLLDFGLATDVAESGYQPLAGTRGYLDPEYLVTGEVTTSSDVYSFGVVLLELLTGLNVYNRDAYSNYLSLVDLAKGKIRDGHFLDILDRKLPRPTSSFEMGVVENVFVLARACLRMSGQARPSTMEIVRRLEDALGISKTEDLAGQITDEDLAIFPNRFDASPGYGSDEAASRSPSLSVASSWLEDVSRD